MLRQTYTLLIVIGSLSALISSCQSRYIDREIRNSDGELSQILRMDRDSVLQGESVTFFENGEDVFERATYVDGELNGVRKLYYSNGTVEIQEYYEDGILIDTLYTYHQNGQVRTKLNYQKGTITGIGLKYDNSGRLLERVTFANDSENGPFEEYHPNGQLHWQGYYQDGPNEVGELREYDTEGMLIKIMSCDSLSTCRTIWTIEDNLADENG
ncbi:MAG: toxin-antitoxin system YwqK family antitoxin [Bacteroidota bacterium]